MTEEAFPVPPRAVGLRCKACWLTLGALAELEVALETGSLMDLVVRSVSSSVAPGGSSTETEMRLTSSGGRNEPGTCNMK